RSLREEPLLEGRVAESAQQRTPVVVRAERVVCRQVFVIVPPGRQFTLEALHRFVSPRPVPYQACEPVDRGAPESATSVRSQCLARLSCSRCALWHRSPPASRDRYRVALGEPFPKAHATQTCISSGHAAPLVEPR